MDTSRNNSLISIVKDITVAKLSSTSTPVNKMTGQDTADFKQDIFDKLVQLHNSN